MSFPREIQVQILINVLIFLGGVGAAVGGWVGFTFVFEPLGTPPAVTRAAVTVNTRYALQSENVVLSADLDRVGRCSFEVVLKTGGSFLLGPLPTVASSFQAVATKPGGWGWYDLAEGILPDWIERVVIRTYPVGWDQSVPLEDRPCEERTIDGR